MNKSILNQLMMNKSIMVPVMAWLTAQLTKVFWSIISNKKLDITRLLGSGGMPSSHSAFILALATVVGKKYGFDSYIFGIALTVSFVVMTDAAGIRRAAGSQAKALNKILFTQNIQFDERLKELLGHTPFEVIIGAFLGITFGLIFG